MLSSIKIKNFKSIVDLKVDFSYAETAPSGYKDSEILHFLPSNSSNRKKRIAPVMMFYGANASGKSNILEVIQTLKDIVLMGLNRAFYLSYKPNKLKSNLNNETFFEIEFFVKNKKYKYTLAYNLEKIIEEKLVAGENLVFQIKNNIVNFQNIETKSYTKNFLDKELFQKACLEEDLELEGDLESENSNQVNTFLNKLIERLPNLNKDIAAVFFFFTHKLKITTSYPRRMYHKNEFIKKDSQNEHFDKIVKFIKKIDIDIERIELNLKKEKKHHRNYISYNEIVTYHKNEENEDIEFKFNEESKGTQVLFNIAENIIKALETGGVLLFDEIDDSIHPLVLKNIIRMFKDKEYNNKNAQLITTLHNTIMLEDKLYRVSEFAFVNKNLKNGTFVKRLSDFEKSRNDLNFRKQYLGGYFLGVPYPFI